MHGIWNKTHIHKSKGNLKWMTATNDYLGCFTNEEDIVQIIERNIGELQEKHRRDRQHEARDKHSNHGNAREGMR